jgi:hypothetical protein
LRLQLTWDGQRIVAAEIAANRLLAARILVGRMADPAVALVPRLFSLCGQAQGVAARLALLAARGDEAGSAELDSALRRVAVEAIGEHLWRLLLDWPALLGQTARKSEFLSWRQRLLLADDAVSAATLGRDLNGWLDRESEPSLEQALGGASTLAQGVLLPWLTAAEWAQQAIDETFAERPHFFGQTAETGALARQSENPEVAQLRRAGFGIAARFAARYADLRALASGLCEPASLARWIDAAPFGERCGLARVETARGVLLHLIQLRDNTVQRYIIVAPTEWNFHPHGAFVREIVGTPATSRVQAETIARRLALALDPCVAYELAFGDPAEASPLPDSRTGE